MREPLYPLVLPRTLFRGSFIVTLVTSKWPETEGGPVWLVNWDAMGGHWGANRRLVVHFRPLVDSLNRCISFYKLDCQNWRRTCWLLLAHTNQTFVLQKRPILDQWSPTPQKRGSVPPSTKHDFTHCSGIFRFWGANRAKNGLFSGQFNRKIWCHSAGWNWQRGTAKIWKVKSRGNINVFKHKSKCCFQTNPNVRDEQIQRQERKRAVISVVDSGARWWHNIDPRS